MVKRPSLNETFLRVAEVIAERATCDRLHVGAVIADSFGRIIATGYNGAPRGMVHCDHVYYERTGDRDPHLTNGHCNNAEHAERNALLYAGADRCRGGTMFTTISPCSACARMIITVGLREVVFRRVYRVGDEALEVLRRAGVKATMLP